MIFDGKINQKKTTALEEIELSFNKSQNMYAYKSKMRSKFKMHS